MRSGQGRDIQTEEVYNKLLSPVPIKSQNDKFISDRKRNQSSNSYQPTNQFKKTLTVKIPKPIEN
jgi:hypothetical protein